MHHKLDHTRWLTGWLMSMWTCIQDQARVILKIRIHMIYIATSIAKYVIFWGIYESFRHCANVCECKACSQWKIPPHIRLFIHIHFYNHNKSADSLLSAICVFVIHRIMTRLCYSWSVLSYLIHGMWKSIMIRCTRWHTHTYECTCIWN